MVASYEITKLPLMYSLSFTGHKAFKLDRFSAMHLRDATLYYYFEVLRLDASELLRSDIKVLLQSETLSLPST